MTRIRDTAGLDMQADLVNAEGSLPNTFALAMLGGLEPTVYAARLPTIQALGQVTPNPSSDSDCERQRQ
ncbi:MAG: hypothetical protein GY832_31270 [Chloroflexi bacterium]|nr:hypothetical protein [Chloroflexota bacterium]